MHSELRQTNFHKLRDTTPKDIETTLVGEMRVPLD